MPSCGELPVGPAAPAGEPGSVAGHPGHPEQRAVLFDNQPLGVDLDRPVEIRHAVPLRPHGLVVEGDQLVPVPLVVPQEETLRVVVDDLDRLVHFGATG